MVFPILNSILTFLHSPSQFALFNSWHIAGGLCLIIAAIMVFSIPKTPVSDKVIRYFIVSCALAAVSLSCFLYRVLPLQVCHVSAWLVVPLALIFKRKTFQYILLYISGWGAILALSVPDLQAHCSMLRYLNFLVMHISLTLAAVYCFVYDKPKLNLMSIFRVLIAFNIYIAPVFLIDRWLHANYVFLVTPPTAAPGLWSWPWYIIQAQLLFIGFSLFVCALSNGIGLLPRLKIRYSN